MISPDFDEDFVESKPITLNTVKVGRCNEETPADDKTSNFEFDYWDCYICSDCKPLKMIAGAEGLVNHCKEKDEHKNVKPLWTFNQNEVKVQDLKKSYKYGVLVREKEREYQEYLKFSKSFPSVGLLYSTFHQPGPLENVDEGVPKLKLKIGKGANGNFSVLS